MKKPSLPVQIIIGLILGIAMGIIELSSTMGWSEFTLDWIAPFGTIFHQPTQTHCHSFGALFDHCGYWQPQ